MVELRGVSGPCATETLESIIWASELTWERVGGAWLPGFLKSEWQEAAHPDSMTPEFSAREPGTLNLIRNLAALQRMLMKWWR